MRRTTFTLAVLAAATFNVFAETPAAGVPVVKPVAQSPVGQGVPLVSVPGVAEAPGKEALPKKVEPARELDGKDAPKAKARKAPASPAKGPLPPVSQPRVVEEEAPQRTTAKVVAVERKPERQPLPGVGELPGARNPLTSNVVSVTSDRTEIVDVAADFANRIATPFDNPRSLAVFSKDTAEISAEGQSLYVKIKNGQPLGIYVTGSNPGDPVVSLTLVPKPIPMQTILLQLNPGAAGGAGAGAIKGTESNNYEDRIRQIMRTVALGQAPAGFVEAALPKAVGRIGALVIIPDVRYSNAALDVFKYRVESVSQDDVELDEAAFYEDGVRAVAVYPKVRLRKGESVTVFVLSDKSALGGGRE